MGLFLFVLASALMLWLIAKNKKRGGGRSRTSDLPVIRANATKSAPSLYSTLDLTTDEQIRQELAVADEAVGGFTDAERAWSETFMRCRQIMNESFAIAEKTKDEITRSSRLEVARNNLERLESLSQSDECPLKLRSSEEIWAEYYRLSGSDLPSTWKEDKPVDLTNYLGRPWGEIVAEMTGGANLVDGKETWELAEEYKHNLSKMLECCQSELRSMEQAGQIPAPFYFERAAILLRKAKGYGSEVKLIELYLAAIDAWNAAHNNARPNGPGARHEKIS